MELFKLTDQNNKTRVGYSNETVWGAGVTRTVTKEGTELCTDQVIHAYSNPYLALLFNPIHADIRNPKLWVADGDVVVNNNNIKVGCKSLTTIKEISLPEITLEQRVEFVIRCVKAVFDDADWNEWADAWLDGTDRTQESAARAAAKKETGAWKIIETDARGAARLAARIETELAETSEALTASWIVIAASSLGHDGLLLEVVETVFGSE